MKELRIAFPKTIPIMAAYLFLGISYGILMAVHGFPFWLPILTAMFVYTGSLEFLMKDILLSAYNPVATLTTALMIGSRHIFYGIAMLPKYRGTGKAKFYLIYTCSDETFAVNYAVRIPAGLDKTRFFTSVSALDQFYWVCGSAIGGLSGSLITFNTTGLDFIMTAMFVTIFMNQWLSDADRAVLHHQPAERKAHARRAGTQEAPSQKASSAAPSQRAIAQRTHSSRIKFSFRVTDIAESLSSWLCTHGSELIGVGGALVCLAVFGPDRFIIPTLILVLILLTVFRKQLDVPPACDAASPDAGEKAAAEKEGSS